MEWRKHFVLEVDRLDRPLRWMIGETTENSLPNLIVSFVVNLIERETENDEARDKADDEVSLSNLDYDYGAR